MAKAEAEAQATESVISLIFPKASVVKDLAKARRSAKERASAITGEIGSAIGKAVEEKHLDRKAFAMACTLNNLDDERLSITLPHLLHYIELLGIDKRASLQGSMFPPAETDPAAAPAKDAKVTPIGGRTPRKTAEEAGDTAH